MPVYIQNYIHDLLAKGEVNVTVLTLMNEGTVEKKISSLTFNQEGSIKDILSGNTTLFGYIDRLVRFGKRDILIYVNGILLDEIRPKPVYAIEHIPELPHGNVPSEES